MNISNYNSYQLIIIKISFGFFLLLVLIKNINLKSIEINNNDFIFFGFLIYLLISILWSKNTQFGLIKFTILTVNFFNLWFIIKAYNQIKSNSAFKLVIQFTILIITIISIILIFIKPVKFTPEGYEIKLFSHVFSGRILTLGYVIVLSLLYKNYDNLTKSNKIYLIISATLIFIAQINVAYRAGILSSLLISAIIFFYFVKSKEIKLSLNKIFILILVFMFIFAFFTENLIHRFNWLLSLINKNEIDDVSILARLEAIKISFHLWKENPIFGIGLGSFNSKISGTNIGLELKYPHNFFFEILSEAGIIGIILTLIIFYKIFKYFNELRDFEIKLILLSFFIVFFIFATFSKDLTFNIVLFLFVYLLKLKF